MQSYRYESEQLNLILESKKNDQYTGIINIETQDQSSQVKKSQVLIWHEGNIVYGGSKVPNNREFALIVGKKFQPNLIDTALKIVLKQIDNSNSVQETINGLVKLRIFKWQEIESFVKERVIWLLEELSSLPGKITYDPSLKFDFSFGEDCHALDWFVLKSELNNRQQKWSSFAPLIPSMNAIPFLTGGGLSAVTNPTVQQHLEEWVDGKTSLVDIAKKLDKDPLNIANSYYQWAQAGWIKFATKPIDDNQIQNSNQPIIVCIDDSPIIRTMLNRTLSDRYQVLLASNAVEGLNFIYNNPISLVILDLSMPDIDGLEVCSTIRKIPKFQELPIIMLTARDGFVNKFKGKMAGSNKYLTKPFDERELLEIVGSYFNI
ncbi:response regulator [Stanieria cyanosphaera]|nr:response regulator [Stanieria cyanosphaera]